MGGQGLHGPPMPCAHPAALCRAGAWWAPTRRTPGNAGVALGAEVATVGLGALQGASPPSSDPPNILVCFLLSRGG